MCMSVCVRECVTVCVLQCQCACVCVLCMHVWWCIFVFDFGGVFVLCVCIVV